MFGGPAFSAQKFQKLVSSVTGRGADGVKKVLTNIGKGAMFMRGAKVADAQKVIGQLRDKGLLKNTGQAAETFRRAARGAVAAARVRETEIRRERLNEFRQGQAAEQVTGSSANSVVRQQEHGVSIFDNSASRHAVSISQKVEHPVSASGGTPGQVAASAATQSQARATAGQKTGKLVDIPLD